MTPITRQLAAMLQVERMDNPTMGLLVAVIARKQGMDAAIAFIESCRAARRP